MTRDEALLAKAFAAAGELALVVKDVEDVDLDISLMNPPSEEEVDRIFDIPEDIMCHLPIIMAARRVLTNKINETRRTIN